MAGFQQWQDDNGYGTTTQYRMGGTGEPWMPGYGPNQASRPNVTYAPNANTTQGQVGLTSAGGGMAPYDPTVNFPVNLMPSPYQQFQKAAWEMPQYAQLGQNIFGMTPNADPFWQKSLGYSQDAMNQAQQMYGNAAQQFGNQMFNQLGGQWNQQLANNPAYGQWKSLLAQQGNEASGSAPQYLQDFWSRKANERLQGNMGAFGAPSSQFAANDFARYNADAANQYHQQAMQNLGGTIQQGNQYMNPAFNTIAGSMANMYSQGIGNAANQGFQFGNQAYQNAVAPIQQFQNKMTQRWI